MIFLSGPIPEMHGLLSWILLNLVHGNNWFSIFFFNNYWLVLLCVPFLVMWGRRLMMKTRLLWTLSVLMIGYSFFLDLHYYWVEKKNSLVHEKLPIPWSGKGLDHFIIYFEHCKMKNCSDSRRTLLVGGDVGWVWTGHWVRADGWLDWRCRKYSMSCFYVMLYFYDLSKILLENCVFLV